MRPMLDAHHPNQADQRAPSTPSHLHVLNELVDITADLIRMVHAQVRQQVEFHLPPTDPDAPPPPPPPWPPITEDPIRAVTELSRSLRLTAALVNKLEQPPKPRNNTLLAPGARPIREETDPARLSDAEKNAPIEACEHECDSEDSELSEEERLEDAIYRPIVKIVAGICRTPTALITSRPDMPGIWTSRKTRSGASRRIASTAVGPSAAVPTTSTSDAPRRRSAMRS